MRNVVVITCSVVVTPNSTAGISIPQPRVHRIRLAMPPDAMRQHTVEETRTLHLSNSPPTATLDVYKRQGFLFVYA